MAIPPSDRDSVSVIRSSHYCHFLNSRHRPGTLNVIGLFEISTKKKVNRCDCCSLLIRSEKLNKASRPIWDLTLAVTGNAFVVEGWAWGRSLMDLSA